MPELLPQAATVPSEHNARLYALPPETATTVLPASAPVMLTGAGKGPSVLRPSWLEALLPHETIVPSVHKARLCVSPAETALTTLPSSAEIEVNGTATGVGPTAELPSWR